MYWSSSAMPTSPETSGLNRSTAATVRWPRPSSPRSATCAGEAATRAKKTTAILWALWGAQAENAAKFLGTGSHVNVVGRVRNNTYEKDGQTIYGLAFTCDEIDYLDSKARGAERRSRHEFVDEMNAAEQAAAQRTKART